MNKRLLLTIVVILAIAGGGWFFLSKRQEPATIRIQASGTIETTDIQVGSQVGGRILSVEVAEGANVQKGQVLVVLDPYQLPAKRAALQAQLAQAQATLTQLENGPRPQEIAQAEAQVRAAQAEASLQRAGARAEDIEQAASSRREAEANFQNSQANYSRFLQLHQQDVVSQQEFENVRTAYEASKQQLEAARQREKELRSGNRPQDIAAAQQRAQAQLEQLRLLQAGTRPEQIAAQKAQLQNITAQIQELDKTASELKIRASCDCQVDSLDWKPGQLLVANQPVASLFDLDNLWIRVYVPEERFGLMHIGDTLPVTVDAYPNQVFNGTIVQLASRAEFTPRNIQTEEGRRAQVFGVKVALDNKNRLLRPGMPANVTFMFPSTTTAPSKGTH